ncbi:hypothetical protein GON03_00715 [Nocardioides sp. MAH-18]|uniref:SHOCT domain-containing protein n=1 Tax=Nocardioides agri TaxID=2682843 RepID=A0A6L6XPY3_9ACTN|nr:MULTISPECIES: DUF6325 family protein [unclassified Nocardioides]MBA2956538.1 hypothetical protein [Nocardioides sp. CGMCC 1.13656]MVQ47685.1 hypothetical protein [Nocardioides sp. MAH-18]
MSDALRLTDTPDLDLLEYVLVSAPSVSGLDQVAAAAAELVTGGVIRLVDVVGLVRADDEAGVRVVRLEDAPPLAALAALADGGVLLSRHDVELAAVTLAPGDAALLLLVEDCWASALSSAARRSGGRLTAGERVGRDRVLAALDEPGRTDLLDRSPLGTARRTGAAPLVDQVAQVRKLAHLVERGLLSLDQYEVQRRRVLEA